MSMAGYTKLFNSILASTIWREPNHVRIVWITLLAMADKNGVAEGSVPGLADFARVSVEECRDALSRLSDPDRDSRSQEHDGRRIQAVDGGWCLLNHAKYRAKLNADERREYNRVKQAESRERKSATVKDVKDVKDVNDESAQSLMNQHSQHIAEAEYRVQSTEADTEADTEATTDAEAQVPRARARSDGTPSALMSRFETFWKAYPRRQGRGAAVRRWTRLKPNDALLARMIAAIEAQKHTPDWTKDGGQFIPHPATWLNQHRWLDERVECAPADGVSATTRANLAARARVLQRIQERQ